MRICSENDVRPEQSAPGVTDAVGPGARNVDHAKAQARYYGSMTAEGKPSTPDALPFTAARTTKYDTFGYSTFNLSCAIIS